MAEFTLLMNSKTLSDDEKLDRFERLKRGFAVSPPTAGSVLGGWLRYAIGPCRRQGVGAVSCEGEFQNQGKADRALATFVTQTGGIRSTRYDHFGIITAVDDRGNTYKAIRITVGNRSNNETGQFGFNLLAGLATHLQSDFDKVDSSATSFFRLTLPLADGGAANGASLAVVIEKVAIASE